MSTDQQIPKTLTGHRVLTCFANVERYNSNFNTTAENYKFEWLKNGIPLSENVTRKNSKNEIIEIMEKMSQPQPGIVLTLNDIEVVIFILLVYCIILIYFLYQMNSYNPLLSFIIF